MGMTLPKLAGRVRVAVLCYSGIGIAVGSPISAINFYHRSEITSCAHPASYVVIKGILDGTFWPLPIRRSEITTYTHSTSYAMICGAKGTLYGAFWLMSVPKIAFDHFRNSDTRRHFYIVHPHIQDT